jgi:hypothetical protein
MTIVAKKADIRKAAKSVGLPLTDSEITRLLRGRQVSLDKLTLYEYGRLLMRLEGAKTTVIREMNRKRKTQKKLDHIYTVQPFQPGDFNGIHFPGGGVSLGTGVGIAVKCWASDGFRCCLYVGLFFVTLECYAVS